MIAININNVFAHYNYFDELIFALKSATNSENLKISFLNKNDQEHSSKIILIGLKNNLLNIDAKLIGNIIDVALNYDPECKISVEWDALEDGLSLIRENITEQDINAFDLERSNFWHGLVKGIDRSLNAIAWGSLGATVLLTSRPDNNDEKRPSLNIPKLGYPSYDNAELNKCIFEVPPYGEYKSHLVTFQPGCVHSFVRQTIGQVQESVQLQYKVANNYNIEQSSPTFSLPPSFYTTATCILATGAQKILHWLYPLQEIPKAHRLADEIVNLLSNKEGKIIISLVDYDSFLEVKSKLLESQFSETDLT